MFSELCNVSEYALFIFKKVKCISSFSKLSYPVMPSAQMYTYCLKKKRPFFQNEERNCNDDNV